MLPAGLIGGVEIARHCLAALCETDRKPLLAIGYPPALAGRSGFASLADVCATHDVPLLETDDVNAQSVVARVREVEPEVLLVVAWSQLLGKELLGAARRGAVGIHPTALPEGRGRAPIPWTLIKGLRRSAVTLFRLTEGVDDGSVIAQEQFEISPHDDAQIVYRRVCDLYAKMLLEHVDAIVAGTAPSRPQEGEASYWPKRRPRTG